MDWKRLGEILAMYWPDGLYFDDMVPKGVPIAYACYPLHYLPTSFAVIKDDASVYAAEHGKEYSCLIHFKMHGYEGIVAVVEADSEGDEVAQMTLDTLHSERT